MSQPPRTEDSDSTVVTTAVRDTKNVSLEQLSGHTDRSLRRIVPPAETLKAPVATFDASL